MIAWESDVIKKCKWWEWTCQDVASHNCAGIWILLAISLDTNEDTAHHKRLSRCPDSGAEWREPRSQLVTGHKRSSGARGRALSSSQKSETMNSAVLISFQYRAASHHVSEVLDARVFGKWFMCLISKRKDIWPICVWLRFRIQPN